MRRSAIGTFLAMTLLAAACAGGTPEAEEGTAELVFATGAAIQETHQQVLDLWNEANPDTPIRGEWLPEDADSQRQQMSLELDAAGASFDVLALDVIWTGEFAENDWIESMEELRPELEDALLAGPIESAEWGGELWAVPYNSNAGFLYYRTDLVDEPPTTWDELLEVGTQAAEEAGIAGYVSQGARYEGLVVNYLEHLWGAGGELLDDTHSEVMFGTDDAAERALDFMRDALDAGFYAPGFNTMMEEEARNEFQLGNAVFMRNWPYAYELMTEEDESEVADSFGIAPLPTFDGEGTVSALGGNNLAVSAFSENKEAAMEFALFAATDPEAQAALARDAVPPVAEAAYDEFADDEVFELLGEVLEDARARPPIPRWNDISLALQSEVFDAYNGDQPTQDAIEAIQGELESIVGE